MGGGWWVMDGSRGRAPCACDRVPAGSSVAVRRVPSSLRCPWAHCRHTPAHCRAGGVGGCAPALGGSSATEPEYAHHGGGVGIGGWGWRGRTQVDVSPRRPCGTVRPCVVCAVACARARSPVCGCLYRGSGCVCDAVLRCVCVCVCVCVRVYVRVCAFHGLVAVCRLPSKQAQAAACRKGSFPSPAPARARAC